MSKVPGKSWNDLQEILRQYRREMKMKNGKKDLYNYVEVIASLLSSRRTWVVLGSIWTILVGITCFAAGVSQLDPRVTAVERQVNEITGKIDKIYDYIVLGAKP